MTTFRDLLAAAKAQIVEIETADAAARIAEPGTVVLDVEGAAPGTVIDLAASEHLDHDGTGWRPHVGQGRQPLLLLQLLKLWYITYFIITVPF